MGVGLQVKLIDPCIERHHFLVLCSGVIDAFLVIGHEDIAHGETFVYKALKCVSLHVVKEKLFFLSGTETHAVEIVGKLVYVFIYGGFLLLIKISVTFRCILIKHMVVLGKACGYEERLLINHLFERSGDGQSESGFKRFLL